MVYNSFFTQRLGLLGYPGVGDSKLGDADQGQLVFAYAAGMAALAELLGFSGGCVFSGGAADLAGLPGSYEDYPPVFGFCVDAAGVPWPFLTTGDTAMIFNATSGACTVYAVPLLMAGISPNNAVGGIANVQFIVQLTASPAPPGGLALGSGNVTASAFTTFTAAAFTPWPLLLTDLGMASFEQVLTNSPTAVPSAAAVTAAIAGITLPSNPVRVFPWPWTGCVLGAATAGSYAGYAAPQVQNLTEGPGGRNYVQVAAPLVGGVQDPGAYTQKFQWEWYLPTEFTGWQSDAVGFDFLTSNNGGTASLGLAVYHNTSATPVYSVTNLTTADAWQTAWITAANLAGVTWAAGDRLTVVLTCSCTRAIAVWLGNASVGYDRA